jgi:hypothetical protein
MQKSLEAKLLTGYGCGAVAVLAWNWTGASIYVHEVVGHVGVARLLYNYAPGRMPTWRVVQWSNFRALGQQPSWHNFKRVLFFTREHGANGWAMTGGGTPNRLGALIGERASSAFISIGGSLPELVLDGAAVEASRHSDDERAAALLTFGLAGHVTHSMYALDAIWKLGRGAWFPGGHDFVNFAQKVSQLSGFSPLKVSVATGILWFGSVTLFGLKVAADRLILYADQHERERAVSNHQGDV